MNFQAILNLVKKAFSEWSDDKASRLAAALAYYTVFSLVPLLVIVIALAGLLGRGSAAQDQILLQLQNLIGQEGRQFFQDMIAGASKPAAGIIATVVGFVTLLFGALAVFGELQESLNTIWEVKLKPVKGLGGSLKRLIVQRLLSFTMILGIGFLLLVSLVLSAVLASIQGYMAYLLPAPEIVLNLLNFVVSFGVIMLLFAMMFKILPDAQIAWKDVWLGSAITALLFTIGKIAIATYLGRSAIRSSFGAAGSIALVLVWVYYSAQILFLGAEFTQVYANEYGSGIQPDKDAEMLSEQDRLRQGLNRSAPVTAAAVAGIAPADADASPAEVPALTMRRRVLALPPPQPDQRLLREVGLPLALGWLGALIVGTLVHFSFIRGESPRRPG